MIAFLIILAAFAYITIGGGVGVAVYPSIKGRCDNCRKVAAGERYACCYSAHSATAGLAGAGWPIVIPAVIGMLAANHIATRAERRIDREKREQLAHERRMTELAEQRRIAELNMKFLEDNGIDARVVGL